MGVGRGEGVGVLTGAGVTEGVAETEGSESSLSAAFFESFGPMGSVWTVSVGTLEEEKRSQRNSRNTAMAPKMTRRYLLSGFFKIFTTFYGNTLYLNADPYVTKRNGHVRFTRKTGDIAHRHCPLKWFFVCTSTASPSSVSLPGILLIKLRRSHSGKQQESLLYQEKH